jgi:hypothetical protein
MALHVQIFYHRALNIQINLPSQITPPRNNQERTHMAAYDKTRKIDDNSKYSLKIKAAFSVGMLMITPFTLALAFYAVYKNPIYLPLIVVALLPAGLSCIGIAGLRRLFNGDEKLDDKTTEVKAPQGQ